MALSTLRLAPAVASRLAFWRADNDSPLGRWRMTFARPLPGTPLAAVIEAMWTIEGAVLARREDILPRSRTEVLINLGGPHRLLDAGGVGEGRRYDTCWVSGLQQGPLAIEGAAVIAMVGMSLRPGGVLPFFGLPPSELAGQVPELDAVLGREALDWREQLAEEAVHEVRLALLAEWVESRVVRGPGCSPAVRFALERLAASGGRMPIRRLVLASGWSERHFITRFRQEIGLSPKAFARVRRFERALLELQQLRSPVRWADFAVDAGYYDQAHLARDFRELAGATPGEVWRRQSPEGLSLLTLD